MIVVCASESPRSAIISTRSRKLSLYRRYQRTQSTMISLLKWRPLKRSSTFNMLGQVHRGVNSLLNMRHTHASHQNRQRQIERGGDVLRFIVAQSFQATMKREKSSSTVER